MKLRLLGATIMFVEATIRIMNICYKKSLILGVSEKPDAHTNSDLVVMVHFQL